MSVGKAVRFALNKPQQVIWNSEARYKVVVAGRRCGKTTLAAMLLVANALKSENRYGDPLDSSSECVYFGTDREQAKRNLWAMLKEFSAPWTVHVHENTCVLTVNNGAHDCRIRLLGMDDPDKARGLAIRFAVMDEYADMHEAAWPEIIRPALMDNRGDALFIGTPKGRNHFYELYTDAISGNLGPEWEAFSFQSGDNDTIAKDELDAMAKAYSRGSPELYQQEIEGRFISKGGQIFNSDDFPIRRDEPKGGTYLMAVDLAGFTKETGRRNAQMERLDETSIAIVKAYPVTIDGRSDIAWWVKEILHGRWDVEETAEKIVTTYLKNRISAIGIEKGALARAVAPYLQQVQTRLGVWMTPRPLTHGNQSKYDRIQWALQGRAKSGLITLNKGEWNQPLIDQAVSFPDSRVHDDLLDSLAFIDQLSDLVEATDFIFPEQWSPSDSIAGY